MKKTLKDIQKMIVKNLACKNFEVEGEALYDYFDNFGDNEEIMIPIGKVKLTEENTMDDMVDIMHQFDTSFDSPFYQLLLNNINYHSNNEFNRLFLVGENANKNTLSLFISPDIV